MTRLSLKLLPALLFGLALFANVQPVAASTNVSSTVTAHWAWNDTIGWMDFYNTNTVNVSSAQLTGYASSSAGDISLDCATSRAGDICGSSNYKVTNDANGNLSGYAWNDVYGWISFDCNNGGTGCGTSSYEVYIDGNGDFQDYAWNDVVGWISFNCNLNPGGCAQSNYKVNSSWLGITYSTGTVSSAVFDTGVSSGAQLNSILWQGNAPAGTNVGFQLAVSNSSSGPWTFWGGTPLSTSTYYTSPNPNTSVALDYSFFSDFRYFRYNMMLYSDNNRLYSPRVDDVMVNWSR